MSSLSFVFPLGRPLGLDSIVINGKFSISSNINVNKQVEIHSLLGKLVYNKEVKGNETILISNLNKGIYILRVEEEGKGFRRGGPC